MRKAWIALSLLTTACSSVDTGTASLERQIEELQARVVALQQQAAIDNVELGSLRTRLEALEDQLGPETAARPGRLGVGIEREEVGLPTTSGVIEESELEELPVVAVEPKKPRMPESKPNADVGVTTDAQGLYDRGFTLHHQERYLEAEEALTRFLNEYPDSELADNALYWIGESRVGRGELQSALASFQDTVSLHPRGNKAPDALYKTGVLLERLGDIAGSRESYLQLLSDYPLSPLTDDARARLDRL